MARSSGAAMALFPTPMGDFPSPPPLSLLSSSSLLLLLLTDGEIEEEAGEVEAEEVEANETEEE